MWASLLVKRQAMVTIAVLGGHPRRHLSIQRGAVVPPPIQAQPRMSPRKP